MILGITPIDGENGVSNTYTDIMKNVLTVEMGHTILSNVYYHCIGRLEWNFVTQHYTEAKVDVTREIEQRAQWSAPAWAACCALCSISCVASTLASVYRYTEGKIVNFPIPPSLSLSQPFCVFLAACRPASGLRTAEFRIQNAKVI